MAKDLEISLVANTRAFVAGAQNAAQSLDKVADSLDDLARESQRQSDKTGDNIKDGVKDGTKDAETAVEKLNRSFRELATEARTESRKAGDDIGDNVKRGTGKADEAVGEFKDEARSNFSEVVSSFDGSMESVADLAQGTLGGLAGSLAGPIGLVAGGLAAAGGALFASMQENAEKVEQRVSDMYADMAESGNKYLSEQFIQQGIQEIIDTDYDKIVDWADKLGESEGAVARAMVTAGEDRDRISQKIQANYAAELEAAGAAEDGYTYTGNAAATAAGQWAQRAEEVAGWNAEQDKAQGKAEIYNEAIRTQATRYGDSNREAQGLRDTVNSMSDKTVKIKVDQSELDALYRKLSNGATVAVSPRVAESAAGRITVP